MSRPRWYARCVRFTVFCGIAFRSATENVVALPSTVSVRLVDGAAAGFAISIPPIAPGRQPAPRAKTEPKSRNAHRNRTRHNHIA